MTCFRITSISLLFIATMAYTMTLIKQQHTRTPARTPEPPELKVIAPLQVFAGADKLLDPHNLQYVFEYYLLENLSVGLVRDNPKVAGGFEGICKRSFRQLSPRVWRFHLRDALFWSDGKPLEPRQIASSLERLPRHPGRHLARLIGLKSVIVNHEKRYLDLAFDFDVNRGVLEELSLPEASILSPQNLRDDWSVTSGFYSVSSFNPEKIRSSFGGTSMPTL